MHAPSRLTYWIIGSLLPIAVVAAPVTALAAPGTLYVATWGSDAPGNPCTDEKPCKTISHAVSLATSGDTVRVNDGTYPESVTLNKRINLEGDEARIDAAGLPNGIAIRGASADGSRVHGFKVENAILEGILAQNVSNVTIDANKVTNNDRGMFLPAVQQTGECVAQLGIPGDCGEGLHLWAVADSRVIGNTVVGNAGGILLTDETGPTHGNTIADNDVSDNQYDCGITVAGHNTGAFAGAAPVPTVGGIYDNTITRNIANRNGVKGQGAGILLAAGAPGSAVYNNVVSENFASGNGLAGITLHSHAPGQDLNGNVLRRNILGTNNIDHDDDFAVPDDATTGITIASAVPHTLTSVTVEGNIIANDHFGIWTLHAPAISRAANFFFNVTVPVQQN